MQNRHKYIPPKVIYSESFMNVQLKPVVREIRKPQKATVTEYELKVKINMMKNN